ncbi:hypothetical protein [Nocardia callitridis]|uniref:DUF222 domain-containing protein n=1 Tax=Nocardia callitridis TaxID=648753 RepID=A0ABP9KIN2_9NOCA
MSNRTDLEQQLGGSLAASSVLSEDEAADLLELFAAARRQERTLLAESVDTTTSALPWPLRSTARKIMFGGHIS